MRYEIFQAKTWQPPSTVSILRKDAKDVESDGDYEQIPVKDDKDEDYAEVTTGTSTIAHATPVLILMGADDGADYAEAEICRSIEWEGFVGREAHRTVISMLEPQVVKIEDDPPLPQRPHSADELDALICGEKDEASDGLFRAVPCRLQRAKQAAHAWAQHLPDLLIPSSNQTEEEKKDEEKEDQDEVSQSQSGDEEEEESEEVNY